MDYATLFSGVGIVGKEFTVMNVQLSQIKWGRVAWTVLTVYGASFLLVFLIVTAYAASLAFQAPGAPDQAMIQAFANQYAPWLGSGSLILFTFLGAMWLARFVRTDVELHGLALGVIVGLVNLIFEGIGAFSLVALVTTVLVVAGGWLGGRMAMRG
jgi:hypothetical protein